MSITFKTIFSGSLEFGNQRSYEQALKLFQGRVETHYRNDILFVEEEVFIEECRTMSVPRLISECSEKSWRNTLNLLEFMSQYAIAGDFRAWIIQDGKLIKQSHIEPSGDKTVIQKYLEGRQLLKTEGNELEAKNALDKAIEKFERHALAYERRGFINFKLGNFDDAMYDYNKSINIDPNNPEAYWGRAKTKLQKKDLNGAIADLELAISNSIPHQPIYWSARRLKGECHLKLGEFQKAIAELKFVTKRAFRPEDPNLKWQKNAHFNYGKALFEVGQYGEAVEAFNKMFNFDLERPEAPSKADQFLSRGLARQKAGESGYLSDLKEAAIHGSSKAAALLEKVA